MRQNHAFKAESRSIARRIFDDVRGKDLSGLAQQIAYNVLFALAPLLIFVVALTGWITQAVNADLSNPAEPVLRWMRDTLPPEAASFLDGPVNAALTTQPGFLLSFGAIAALWGARNAVSAVIKGLNVAYGVENAKHSWLRGTIVSLALTIGIGVMIAAASFIFLLGTGLGTDLADAVGLGGAWATVSSWLRWPLIGAVVILSVALIHRFGPNIDAPLRWYLPGATFSVIAMLIATSLLGVYFSVIGGYSEGYGVFGAVLAFVFWLYIMALLLLIGGVINDAVQKEIPAARSAIARRNHTVSPA
jgi:membrane protein